MSVSVNGPKTPVTAGSTGVAAATIPNVCKMPGPPAPFVPAPLPNIGKSGDSPEKYSKSVTFEGHAVAIKGATFKSQGDIASKGTGGGLISSNTHGPTSFVGPGSMDVKIEGKNVQLLSDPMLNNCGPSGSPPNAATLMGVIQRCGRVTAAEGNRNCPICEEAEHEPLKETKATKLDARQLAQRFKIEVTEHPAHSRPTMLGVVQCGKCSLKYASQSGRTTTSLIRAAQACSMQTKPRDAMPPGGEPQWVKQNLAKVAGDDAAADAWTEGEVLFEQSRNNEDLPRAYPPGVCAAQTGLALARERGAFPTAMTERWYHPEQKPTAGRIEHIDVRSGKREVKVKSFRHAETVPPCKTCVLIVPLLLCLNKDEKCTDQPQVASS